MAVGIVISRLEAIVWIAIEDTNSFLSRATCGCQKDPDRTSVQHDMSGTEAVFEKQVRYLGVVNT
eukprot:scaffold776_cov347-Pavlova_lutheri.AAC.157